MLFLNRELPFLKTRISNFFHIRVGVITRNEKDVFIV